VVCVTLLEVAPSPADPLLSTVVVVVVVFVVVIVLWCNKFMHCSFGVMPLEVTPSPAGPPSSALTSMSNHISTSPAISAHFKVVSHFPWLFYIINVQNISLYTITSTFYSFSNVLITSLGGDMHSHERLLVK